MTFKQGTVKNEKGEEFTFFFDFSFSDEGITDICQLIRVGDRNWTKPFIDSEVVIKQEEMLQLEDAHKYIIFYSRRHEAEQKSRIMVVFPINFDHDRMCEMTQHGIIESEMGNHDPIDVFSAGFVTPIGFCYGRSETLDVDSTKEDTSTYRLTFL